MKSLILVLALLAPLTPARAADPEAAKQEIKQADLDFCALAAKSGILPAFLSYGAPDAAFLDHAYGGPHGAEAIKGRFGAVRASTVLTWKPDFADVGAAGDLGYTRGPYELRETGADGKVHVETGHYCTIWRRQPGGSWKFVLDTGESDPPPKSP